MKSQLVTSHLPQVQTFTGDSPADALIFYDADSSLLATHFGSHWDQYRTRLGTSSDRVKTTHVVLPPGSQLPGGEEEFFVIGLAKQSMKDLHRAGAAITRAALEAQAGAVIIDFASDFDHDQLRALGYGLMLGAYRHPRVSSTETGADPSNQDLTDPLKVFIRAADEAAANRIDEVLGRAQGGAHATWLAREWAATPSNFKNPAWLVAQTESLVAQLPESVSSRVKVTAYDEAWLESEGFGGILAVGSGSTTPPQLLVVEYRPNDDAPLVLVGKGITYDTGGLALKPREGMVSMKTDMSGAAIVVQAVLAAAKFGGSTPVVAVAALAENTMGAGSYRPGDVLTMVDGTTVEIGNTDAEGRLVLADAMAWSAAKLKPAAIVDVATLTGAISLGLGKQYSAVYTRDDQLFDDLQAASQRANERIWQMPLATDYEDAMESVVADLNHIATDSSVKAGSITAALFLERFAHDVPWAHFDIAGTGRSDGDYFDGRKGATGVLARTLFELLTH